MLSEEKATGWLIFTLFEAANNDVDASVVPDVVWQDWKARGWIDEEDDLTQEALAVADLNAPDWGVELNFDDA